MNQKVDKKLLDAAKKEAEKLKNKSKTGVTSFSRELIEKIKGALSDEDAKKILDRLPIDIDPGIAPPKTVRPAGVPRDIDPGMGSTVRRGKEGGLMEATAKLKAKGLKDGGMVVKDKTVAIDKSPNSGLITQRGFGASRRT
jgi:hypothetical protein